MTTKKYSLRKVKVGVASVLVGFGVATTGAVVANAADDAIAKLDANTPALTSKEIDALNNSLDEAAKDREETAKNLEKETNEAAAQKEFLANYDKALTDSVAELEKAGTTSPEEAKAKADVIAKLKEEAAAKREAFVDGFKSGLTVEDANKLIDEENNPQPAALVSPENRELTTDEYDKLMDAYDTAKEEEALLPTSVKKEDLLDELEKQIDRDKKQVERILEEAQEKAKTVNLLTEELEESTSQLKAVEALKDADPAAAAKINTLKAKVAQLESELETATNDYNASKAVLESLKNEINELTDDYNYTLGEYHLYKVEELKEEIATLEENIKNTTDKDLKAILEKDLADKKAELEKAEKEMEDVLNVIDPLVLPEDQQPAPTPAPTPTPTPVPGLGSVTGGNDFGQKAPEVKEEVKEASASLPNTGLNSTSTTVAGLGLIALVGLAVRRKLAK